VWHFYFNKRQFIYFLIIFATLFLIVILPGLFPTLSYSETQVIMENNNVASQSATVASIFNNNLLIAGITLIPYVGWGWIICVLWQTGIVVSCYG
jgi:hypothetical protein